jgi:hypothetical protein
MSYKAAVSGSCWNPAPQRVIAPYAKTGSLTKMFLSKTVHVKRGLNLGGPPSKAKYFQMTDSGQVP